MLIERRALYLICEPNAGRMFAHVEVMSGSSYGFDACGREQVRTPSILEGAKMQSARY